MSYAALCLYAAGRARRARVRCTNRAGAGRVRSAPRRKDNPMPYQTLPDHEENDELQLCYLLITSRSVEYRGGLFVYLFVLGVFLAAAGALSLVLDLAGVL